MPVSIPHTLGIFIVLCGKSLGRFLIYWVSKLTHGVGRPLLVGTAGREAYRVK
jgi:hypothetical protein